ncbi:depupylase/deamidase Dop [Georgenia sp. Z1491]|uniref:depupylase/deamidase Dop n=1 Tax=Georgenia sp. Z1491 TaxID=3416707 RepID=UPI003CF5CAFB
MGTETEFGVLDHTDLAANAVRLSTRVVHAYQGADGTAAHPSARWDYVTEDPLNDLRGHRVPRASAHPSQLTDDPERPAPAGPAQQVERPSVEELDLPVAGNALLSNGARLYVDHAHPEYSGPETVGPFEALVHDRAGERVAVRAMHADGGEGLTLYKNNVDGKGASYGTHENYLLSRDVDLGDLVRYLTPLLVTRQVVAGAGRVGLGQRSERPGFQIAQRSDYVENDVGLETTFNRPIVNMRDEPHADAGRYRRLHVIGGDANLFDVPFVLRTGTVALLLWLLERGQVPIGLDTLVIAAPVPEVQRISHDPTLRHRIAMREGPDRTALDIQRTYRDILAHAVDEAGGPDAETSRVLNLWSHVLDTLATDIDAAAPDVEWVSKLQLLERMRERDSLGWDSPRLAALDLQWHDLRPERSVVARLDAAGRVTRLADEDAVRRAEHEPPVGTRAYLRGEVLRRYPSQVTGAGWASVVLDLPGRERLARVTLPEPARGTRELVGELLDASPDAAALLDALTGGPAG